jgi:hypothetical protein
MRAKTRVRRSACASQTISPDLIVVFKTGAGTDNELASERAMVPLHSTSSMCRSKDGICTQQQNQEN